MLNEKAYHHWQTRASTLTKALPWNIVSNNYNTFTEIRELLFTKYAAILGGKTARLASVKKGLQSLPEDLCDGA